MTDNHQLLYRLAELMLQHEQHTLPVDLLFDDDQIGDFVKSIQIDSPYQQMLLEGVLTETVSDEKLYVGFTVEGYFHYVLGEVIYNQTEGKDANDLKKLVEENKLKGAKEGVEKCLLRDVQKDDLTRLMWLIDAGGAILDICSVPLASAFLMATFFLRKEEEHSNTKYFIKLENVFNSLISDQTENDIKVLQKALNHLKKAQQQNLVSDLYKLINERISPDNLIKASLYVRTIEYIPKDHRTQKLKNLSNTFKPAEENKELSNFYSIVSIQYRINENYEEALHFIEKSWEILGNIKGRNERLRVEYYDLLGKIYKGLNKYNTAIEYFNKSLNLSIKKDGEYSAEVAVLNTNIGFTYILDKNYDFGIKYLEKSFTIISKIFGNHHTNISRIYMMYATALITKKEYEKALEIYHKSIYIELKVYGSKSEYVAILYQAIGNIWKIKKDYNKVVYYYNQSLIIYLKIDEDCSPEIAEIYSNLGFIYLKNRKEFDLAIQQFENALKRNILVHGKLHPNVSDTLSNLGLACKGKSQYEKAIEYLEKSASIRYQINGDLDIKLASCHNTIAICWEKKKDYKNALDNYFKALKISLHHYNEKQSFTATIYNSIGLIYYRKGDYELAIEYFEKSLFIRLEINSDFKNELENDKIMVFKQNHLNVASSFNNLGLTWKNKLNFEKSLEYLEKSASIRCQINGDLDIKLASCYDDIALCWKKKNNYDNALENYKKALKVSLYNYNEKHIFTATIYNSIGLVYYLKDDYEFAIEYFEKSLFIRLEILGDFNKDVAVSFNNLAIVYFHKTDYYKAIEFYQKSIDIKLKILGDQHPEIATYYNNIGQTWSKIGDYSKALEYFKRAYLIKKNEEFPFKIAECYEKLDLLNSALEYFHESAVNSNLKNGLEDDRTKKASFKILEIAKILNTTDSLPAWIKSIKNDL